MSLSFSGESVGIWQRLTDRTSGLDLPWQHQKQDPKIRSDTRRTFRVSSIDISQATQVCIADRRPAFLAHAPDDIGNALS
jgi:hypothetical protein